MRLETVENYAHFEQKETEKGQKRGRMKDQKGGFLGCDFQKPARRRPKVNGKLKAGPTEQRDREQGTGNRKAQMIEDLVAPKPLKVPLGKGSKPINHVKSDT